MASTSDLQQLAAQLRKPDLLERWLAATSQRAWLLRPTPQLQERCQLLLDALYEGVRQAASLAPGAPELREPLQILSFTAGGLAGSGHSITDALALVHGLREALPQLPAPFAEALAIAAAESFAAARQQMADSRLKEVMARSQLVCLLHPQLPCLVLVGEPDSLALDDAVGRLLMLALMRQASCAIIETSGLLDPESVLLPLCRQLGSGSWRLPGRLLISGVTAELQELLEGQARAVVSFTESLAEALDQVAASCGLCWPSPG